MIEGTPIYGNTHLSVTDSCRFDDLQGLVVNSDGVILFINGVSMLIADRLHDCGMGILAAQAAETVALFELV